MGHVFMMSVCVWCEERWKRVNHNRDYKYIFHGCIVWIKNLSRGSLIGIPSNGFFYLHYTPMIDTFFAYL